MIVIPLSLLLHDFKHLRLAREDITLTSVSNLPTWAGGNVVMHEIMELIDDEIYVENEQRREEMLAALRAENVLIMNRLTLVELLSSEISEERINPRWVVDEDGSISSGELDSLAARLLDESGELIQEAVDTWRLELVQANRAVDDENRETGDRVIDDDDGNTETGGVPEWLHLAFMVLPFVLVRIFR